MRRAGRFSKTHSIYSRFQGYAYLPGNIEEDTVLKTGPWLAEKSLKLIKTERESRPENVALFVKLIQQQNQGGNLFTFDFSSRGSSGQRSNQSPVVVLSPLLPPYYYHRALPSAALSRLSFYELARTCIRGLTFAFLR